MKYNLYYGIRLHSSYDTLKEAKKARMNLNNRLATTIFYRGKQVN